MSENEPTSAEEDFQEGQAQAAKAISRPRQEVFTAVAEDNLFDIHKSLNQPKIELVHLVTRERRRLPVLPADSTGYEVYKDDELGKMFVSAGDKVYGCQALMAYKLMSKTWYSDDRKLQTEQWIEHKGGDKYKLLDHRREHKVCEYEAEFSDTDTFISLRFACFRRDRAEYCCWWDMR